MATIIDELVTVLRLDPAPFLLGKKKADEALKQTKDAAQQTGTNMELAGKKAASFFSQIKREAMGLGLVLGGVGLGAFVKNTIDTNAAIGHLSDNINTATQNLSAWQGVVKSVGGQAGEATSSLQALSQAYQNYRIGIMPSASFIQGLNLLQRDTGVRITMEDMADPNVAMQKLAQAASRTTKPQFNTIAGMLGIAPGAINALELGPDELNRRLAKQAQVTREEADAAEKAQDAINSLNERFKSLTNRVVTDLIPALDSLLTVLTRVLDLIEKEGNRMGAEKAAFDAKHVRTANDRTSDALWNSTFGRIFGYRGNGGPGNWGGDPVGTVGSPVDNGATTPHAAVTAPPRPTAGATSRETAVRDSLARDLGISKDAAAGVVSNLVAESGLQAVNERHPLIPGSRGGFGWAQWTASRRRDFEAWAAKNGLSTSSDAANYGFLIHELSTRYPGIVSALRKARSATEAAGIFFQYESGGSPLLSRHLAGHTRHANRIAHNSSEVNIGTINVNAPHATDAKGVASGMKSAVDSHFSLATQANSGLN